MLKFVFVRDILKFMVYCIDIQSIVYCCKKSCENRISYCKSCYICDVVILRLTHSEQHVGEHFSRFDEKIMVRKVLSLTMRNTNPNY